MHMKHKKLSTVFCSQPYHFGNGFPALANSANDEVGAATTLYQDYLTNNAVGEIQIETNVAGKSPAAENFINDALDLSTRLVPFSLDASMQYYTNVNPTTFFVTFRGREYNDLNQQVLKKAKEIAAQTDIYTTDYEKLRIY